MANNKYSIMLKLGDGTKCVLFREHMDWETANVYAKTIVSVECVEGFKQSVMGYELVCNCNCWSTLEAV